MRAAMFSRFGGPDVLRIADIPAPHAGPGEVRIAVRAAGVTASDGRKRQGHMDRQLPQTLGYEAAGVVDEVGEGVSGTVVGDRVFGASPYGQAQAEFAVLSSWAEMPRGVDFTHAAAIPAAAETAARALDQLGVTPGSTLLINGASGNVGVAAVQFAVSRGARVIGTASPTHRDLVASLGAVPVAYGPGMAERVRAQAPGGVDFALDVAGNGILPELIELTGSADRVLTVADFAGSREHAVRFSRGDSGRATYALAEAAERLAEGRLVLPTVHAYPLRDIAVAHHDMQSGAARGKIVLTVDHDG